MPSSKTDKKPKSRPRRGGLRPFPMPKLEHKTLAVSFSTREEAEQSARDIQLCLDEGWGFRQIGSTPHADHGVVVFTKEIPDDQSERQTVIYGRK